MSLRSYEEELSENSQQLSQEQIIESPGKHKSVSNAWQWISLALCASVLVSGVVELLSPNRPTYAAAFAPYWIPIVAAIVAMAGIIQLNGSPKWFRVQRVFRWSGLLLMVWTANGLPFDLLRLTPLMPLGDVDWLGLVTRSLALAATVMLARIALARPTQPSTRAASWYGYAAFLFALPYPVLRICWAFGSMIGITIPGAAGKGFAPLIFAIPWMLAAALSLLLVSTSSWKPRRFLLTAGWTATAIVSMIGPMAFWLIITKIITGDLAANCPPGMEAWVPCLFYSSWFLWAIAG
jgi:hypothetical protein